MMCLKCGNDELKPPNYECGCRSKNLFEKLIECDVCREDAITLFKYMTAITIAVWAFVGYVYMVVR